MWTKSSGMKSPAGMQELPESVHWRAMLRARRFDCAILLQNAIEAAIIARLAGIPIRAGYNSDARGWLLTHSVQRTQGIRKIHQTGYYVEMLKALGFRSVELTMQLRLPAKEAAVDDRLFDRFGIDRMKPLIGMAPGAAYGPAKRWPADRFAQVAKALVKAYDGNVILLGSRSDRTVTDMIARSGEGRVLNLAGDTTLKEAMALIAQCTLFISNDSGLMHVAGSLGIPTLAIFGSTNPVTTSPPGEQCRIIRKTLPCSPCLKKQCSTGFQCMMSITAAEVIEAAQEMINAKRQE